MMRLSAGGGRSAAWLSGSGGSSGLNSKALTLLPIASRVPVGWVSADVTTLQDFVPSLPAKLAHHLQLNLAQAHINTTALAFSSSSVSNLVAHRHHA